MMRPRLEVLVSEALHQSVSVLPPPMFSKYSAIESHPYSACILFCLHSACTPSELGTCSLIWKASCLLFLLGSPYPAHSNAPVSLCISTLGWPHPSLYSFIVVCLYGCAHGVYFLTFRDPPWLSYQVVIRCEFCCGLSSCLLSDGQSRCSYLKLED